MTEDTTSIKMSVDEDTIIKLTDSINQQSATAMIAIPVPEFGGTPSEDIKDFIRRYKMATINFGEEMRCRALQKALVGHAHTWAKRNIKEEIVSGEKGSWKKIKEKLVERFEAPNAEIKLHEQLSNMKFDQTGGTLISYLESFYDRFRKVHKQAKDADVIGALKLNLPNNIHRALNLLNDEWTQLDNMADLYKLARRAEEKILPFEKEESSEEKLSASSIKKLLSDFLKSAKEVKTTDTKQEDQTQVVAAVQCTGQCQANIKTNASGQTATTEHQKNGEQNWFGPRRNRFKGIYSNKKPAPYSKKDPKSPDESSEDKLTKAQEAYVSIHGKPPGPCQICRGYHFNRHCPLKNLN